MENQVIVEKPKPKYYTDAHRIAQQKYREKNREEYNKSQRDLYVKLHQDEEWKKKFNERSSKNNLSYRQKKREEFIKENPDHIFRGRGRPRKTPLTPLVISNVENMVEINKN
jgi:hypothetical protein